MDYRLAAKTGALFGLVSGVFELPLQTIGFLGLNDMIRGSQFLPQLISSMSSNSTDLALTTLKGALAGVIGGVIYVIIFMKIKNRIPTKRTQTKAFIFFLVASVLLDWIPYLVQTTPDLLKTPYNIGTYFESFSVSIVLTLFWGTLFAYIVTQMEIKIADNASTQHIIG